MNDETKKCLKKGAVILAASIIGGFIGGMLGCCCHKCCCGPHHPHFKGPKMHGGFEGRMPAPEFRGKFIEEDYIIIPKDALNYAGKPDKNEHRIPEGKGPKPVNAPKQ